MSFHRHAAARRPFGLLLAGALTVALLGLGGGVANASEPAPEKSTARYEVDFMTDMIDHHAMAIMMAEMCLDKAVHEELESMCADIIAAQQAEIETLQGWLAEWYGVDYEPDLTNGDMMSMMRLHRLEGAEFEITFMRMMAKHHWKALTMAEGCVDRAYHGELVEMCQEIIAAQSAEIAQLQEWLCDWYGRCGGRPVRTA